MMRIRSLAAGLLAVLLAVPAGPGHAQSVLNTDAPPPTSGPPATIGNAPSRQGGGVPTGLLIGAGVAIGGLLLYGISQSSASHAEPVNPPAAPPPPHVQYRIVLKVKDPDAFKRSLRQSLKRVNEAPRPGFTPPAPDEHRYVADEILVSIKAQASPRQLRRFEARYGLTPLAKTHIALLDRDVRRYRLGRGGTVPATIAALRRSPRFVAAAQPNFLFEPQEDAAKPPAPPALPPQYAVTTLKLADAHKRATGVNVLIAVIDTGLDETHPDLAGTVADRFDAVGGPFVPLPHGTAMAGVIVAHKTLVGAAPDARLIAIRAFASPSGGGPNGTSYNILRGLDFAAAHGARVVNMSFAGPEDALLDDALDAARKKGIVEIAAAGNAGPASKPLYPAAHPGVIAVTATDADNTLFAMANRGAYVAVAAPGVKILAPSINGAMQLTSGTSVATAEVSGIAALLIQANATARPDDIRALLRDTAHPLAVDPAAAGGGVADALAALNAVKP